MFPTEATVISNAGSSDLVYLHFDLPSPIYGQADLVTSFSATEGEGYSYCVDILEIPQNNITLISS